VKDHERIAGRLSKFRPSLTLALKTLVASRVDAGQPVFDFGLGETKGPLDEEIRAAGVRAFREQDTMYGDPAGLPELRESVLRWLGLEDRYSIGNVVINTGAKQGLFNIFLTLCNPADAVLFEAAPWVSYQPLAVAAYGFPVMVLAREPGSRLKVTPADLERNLQMRPHARLFLLNNPVNPTGQLYDEGEVEALLRICVEHRIYFVLDRLYWRLLYDGRTYPEPRLDDETRPWLIQIDGMSKNFRRTGGLRIGWTIAPDDVATAMINLQSHYTSGPATPTQRAAQAALDHPYDLSMVADLQRKRDLLTEHARGTPHVEIWPTPATFYSFWDVRGAFGRTTPSGKVLRTSNDVSEYLVTDGGVITASGTGFLQEGFLRLSFATSDATIVDGMAAAKRAFSALR
jgi:aspartate aminotransferase